MAHDRSNHPCLRRALPDCDDKNRGCELRKALNAYDRLMAWREPVPPDLQRDYAIAFREIYGINRDVRRAEARMAS